MKNEVDELNRKLKLWWEIRYTTTSNILWNMDSLSTKNIDEL
jgi:hypothetical protein